jgi:hypothetical protein
LGLLSSSPLEKRVVLFGVFNDPDVLSGRCDDDRDSSDHLDNGLPGQPSLSDASISRVSRTKLLLSLKSWPECQYLVVSGLQKKDDFERLVSQK